jgi:hypothetical protein
MLLWLSLALGGLGYLFRRQIRAQFVAALPDRETRHRVVGTIIAAFMIVFVARLLVRFWGG